MFEDLSSQNYRYLYSSRNSQQSFKQEDDKMIESEAADDH
jgi:hypothetical protein